MADVSFDYKTVYIWKHVINRAGLFVTSGHSCKHLSNRFICLFFPSWFGHRPILSRNCPWTVTAELHTSQFPHCMESQVSLLSLAPHLGVSKGTLGLHILKCCSFNSQDTLFCTKFLLIIQVAFEEEFHLLWCQAQVYDPLKDVSARNQSDSNHVCDSTQ